MNRHNLNYHTRLHDWYRQHSIQLQLQQEQQDAFTTVSSTKQPQPPAATSFPATGTHGQHLGTAAPGDALSPQKKYAINEWCAQVNKTLFRVKRQESPPLYRRCRLSAHTASAIASATMGDPRRVKSAEVFTLAGHWAKMPKPVVSGGQLLMKGAPRHDANHVHDLHHGGGPGTSHPDFCVKNSKDCEQREAPLARVNHDCLVLRHPAHASTHEPRRRPGSPKNGSSKPAQGADEKKQARSSAKRAQSAVHHDKRSDAAYYIIDNRGQDKDKLFRSQADMDRVNNIKNYSETKGRPRRRGEDTEEIDSEACASKCSRDVRNDTAEDINLIKTVIDVRIVRDESARGTAPTFCNECSGIYSRDAQPPATPNCGNCVHGIAIETEPDDLQKTIVDKEAQEERIALAQIQLEKKLNETEKQYKDEVCKAGADLKMLENRLTDDSLHYSSERDDLRNGPTKRERLVLPNTFDDLGDERNLSFEDNDDGSASFERNESLCSSSTKNHSLPGDQKTDQQQNIDMNETKDTCTINITCDDSDQHSQQEKPLTYRSFADEVPSDPLLLSDYSFKRCERRLSVVFPDKPQVGNPSLSNSLLHVLSIDDCKISMRYGPHKVLEEHQITDSLMKPLEALNTSVYSSSSSSAQPNNPESRPISKVAMRISRGSSVTSLQSSSVQDVTRANKKQYQNLLDPERADYRGTQAWKRAGSASLAKAFHTLIHDRTIMQRLDRPTSSPSRVNCHATVHAREGPVYKRANAALRKHMNGMMQAHCVQMKSRYDQKKAGFVKKKAKKASSVQSQSTDISLSLESLPLPQKGILKKPSSLPSSEG